MTTLKLAIAGVGNCASSLVQGLEYYRDADPTDDVPGLMHVELGGYHVRDIELVAAFDVDATKVGQDLSKAIFAGQNNTIRFARIAATEWLLAEIQIEAVHNGVVHGSMHLFAQDGTLMALASQSMILRLWGAPKA